jgi:hypothetical protein
MLAIPHNISKSESSSLVVGLADVLLPVMKSKNENIASGQI